MVIFSHHIYHTCPNTHEIKGAKLLKTIFFHVFYLKSSKFYSYQAKYMQYLHQSNLKQRSRFSNYSTGIWFLIGCQQTLCARCERVGCESVLGANGPVTTSQEKIKIALPDVILNYLDYFAPNKHVYRPYLCLYYPAQSLRNSRIKVS